MQVNTFLKNNLQLRTVAATEKSAKIFFLKVGTVFVLRRKYLLLIKK